MSYNKSPSTATLKPSRFEARADDKKLNDFKTLLDLSPIATPTYENTTRKDGQYGVSREWAQHMKDNWLNHYDWRKTEKHINSFNNYTVDIKSKHDETVNVHFIALYSQNPDAVPVALIHGWPGSFLEFLPFLDAAKKKYPDPKDLPYHYIVPSMPGYTYSSGPNVDREWNHEDITFVLNELMVGLGFGAGYVAHGEYSAFCFQWAGVLGLAHRLVDLFAAL